MAQDTRIRMPASTGGLVRYFDEYKSKIEFNPIYVLYLIALVIIIEILLHQFGSGLFLG